MTGDVRGWLASREPAPPPALAERVAAMLDARSEAGGVADDRAETVAESCLDAAEHALRRVLRDGDETRALALDLLAADALVTYAFEAASERPATLAPLARDAMRRMARLAEAT